MTKHNLSERQIEILRAGGALNAARRALEQHNNPPNVAQQENPL